MSFFDKIKNSVPVHAIEKELDEIEEHLNVTNKEIDRTLNKITSVSSGEKKKKRKVDAEWVTRTAYKKIKLSLRKMSKHM
ncbi:MAG: hypothetical protein MJB12_16885 [Firmicutes bacterium]|nr:hypothetical protein [Bacillota bacterium]